MPRPTPRPRPQFGTATAAPDEVLAGGEGSPAFAEVQNLPSIQTRAVANRKMVADLQEELDTGEAEAIVLAQELHADLLIDERRRRD